MEAKVTEVTDDEIKMAFSDLKPLQYTPDTPFTISLPSMHSSQFLNKAQDTIQTLLRMVKFNMENYQTCFRCGSFFSVREECIICHHTNTEIDFSFNFTEKLDKQIKDE
jgi:hypothetical protein